MTLRANSMQATSETTSEKYLRHIRNAVVILASLAVLAAAAGAIFGIASAVHAHDVQCQQNPNLTCYQN